MTDSGGCMVISWTRLLGTARVTIHTGDKALRLYVEEALRDHAQLAVEAGAHGPVGTTPHLVLVDLDPPHAVDTLRAYTQRSSRVPTIALTRDTDLQPRLAAFANGADDVIALPAAHQEIAARVRALLRRS